MTLRQYPLLSTVVAISVSTAVPSVSPFSYEWKQHYFPFDRQCMVPRRQVNDRRKNISYCTSSLDSTVSQTNDYDAPDMALPSSFELIEACKRDLIQQCSAHSLESGKKSSSIESKILELEKLGVESGFGLESSLSGLLSGEWELIYSSDDITRSSPFFWAFRRAFPDSSDQIFGITDAIPSPIKEIGPAFQIINVDHESRPITGTLVSRVKVATMGGQATSIMTTRCSILCEEGVDGLRLKVKTTKPEDSTVLQKLGPLGNFFSTSSPPFPSGEALEQIVPGSSEVVMRTTYCDEGLRISRNMDRAQEDVFVWKRVKFSSGSTLSL